MRSPGVWQPIFPFVGKTREMELGDLPLQVGGMGQPWFKPGGNTYPSCRYRCFCLGFTFINLVDSKLCWRNFEVSPLEVHPLLHCLDPTK